MQREGKLEVYIIFLPSEDHSTEKCVTICLMSLEYRSFDVGSIPWELNNIRRTYKKYFWRVHITLKQIKVTEPDSCNSNDKLLLLKVLFMCSRLIFRMCCTLTFWIAFGSYYHYYLQYDVEAATLSRIRFHN